jgi:hypothetical protein
MKIIITGNGDKVEISITLVWKSIKLLAQRLTPIIIALGLTASQFAHIIGALK